MIMLIHHQFTCYKKSRYELEKARNLIADILNVKSNELVFTSGAT